MAVADCRSRAPTCSRQPDCETGVLESDRIRTRCTHMVIKGGPVRNGLKLALRWCVCCWRTLQTVGCFPVNLANSAALHDTTLLSAKAESAHFSFLFSSTVLCPAHFCPHLPAPVYPGHPQFHHRCLPVVFVVVVFRSCKLSKPTFPSWRATLSFTRPAPPSIQVVK